MWTAHQCATTITQIVLRHLVRGSFGGFCFGRRRLLCPDGTSSVIKEITSGFKAIYLAWKVERA